MPQNYVGLKKLTLQHAAFILPTGNPAKFDIYRQAFDWHVMLEVFYLRPLLSPQCFQPSRVCDERGSLQLQARHCCHGEGLRVAGHAMRLCPIYKATLAKISPDQKDLAAEAYCIFARQPNQHTSTRFTLRPAAS